MKHELNATEWANIFVVCTEQLSRLEAIKAQCDTETDEIKNDFRTCFDTYLNALHLSRSKCTEFIEKCNSLLSELAIDHELHAALASETTLQTAWSVWSGNNEIQPDESPIKSSVSSPSSKAEVEQASRCPAVLKVYPKVLKLEALWPRSTSGKRCFVLFWVYLSLIHSFYQPSHCHLSTYTLMIIQHTTTNQIGMTVPLELVRQKRVALTDTSLVHVLGEDYCLLNGLITTATTATSVSKSSVTTIRQGHAHTGMHSHVSSATPTSAGKPASSHRNNNTSTTTTTTITTPSAMTSNTFDRGVTDDDVNIKQGQDITTSTSPCLDDDPWLVYRAGVWAVLGVLVAVLTDRLAMAWYGSNNNSR